MRQTRVAKRCPGPASWPLRLRPLAWGAAGALIVIRRFRWNPGPNSRCRPRRRFLPSSQNYPQPRTGGAQCAHTSPHARR